MTALTNVAVEGEKDEIYHWDTVKFLVEACIFKVPRYQFVIGSTYFAERLESTKLSDDKDDGAPVIPEGVTASQFRVFLKLLFPIYTTSTTLRFTKDEWLIILELSTRWHFHEFRKLAKEHLDPQIDDPIERIVLGRAAYVPTWVLDGYESLVIRPECISEQESERIGHLTTVRLYILRHERCFESCASRFREEILALERTERDHMSAAEKQMEEEKQIEEERLRHDGETQRLKEEEERRMQEDEMEKQWEKERRMKEEEERRMQEEEEMKRKWEEEQRMKEEEERQMQELEEMKRKWEEEQRMKEEEETKRKRQEEQRMKEEEEMQQKRQEEQRMKAEEERRMQEEEEMKRKWEEEQRMKAEQDQRMKEEEEKRRNEEEERYKEKQSYGGEGIQKVEEEARRLRLLNKRQSKIQNRLRKAEQDLRLAGEELEKRLGASMEAERLLSDFKEARPHLQPLLEGHKGNPTLEGMDKGLLEQEEAELFHLLEEQARTQLLVVEAQERRRGMEEDKQRWLIMANA
ncbi:hypothetical protein EST38_g10676 [Candolleomyces aberdarensis]|uniref:BTB domain-containing protein n=1 Tax=Candolleomyces aberdarensis TaxID=2316362 RepID=A0A4Q2D976_9AGAR|nr:hypothetical protein EST38_g10676 [Candolleomyces aberdarensis]